MRNAGEVYVGPYILQDTIGVGTTGKVKAGFHKQTGQRVAVKIVKKKNMEDNLEVRQRVEREVKVLKLLNHPNVMKLYDVLQTSTHLFVVVELLEGGQLYDHVSAHPLLGEAEVFQFFYQLTTGIAFMHSQNICHRNVKLENLLLDSAGNLKIADLEMASAIPRGRYLETSCGSPHYACPEIVKNERYLGTAADVWSCGVLLYALTTNTLPFDAPSVDQLFAKIKAGRFHMPSDISPSLQDLLARMLAVKGDERITTDEIQQHPYWMENLHYVSQ
eukprot:Rhum_TRINITY_DN7645_c0_g1::Rhum_TRINITY_DN7645_c0_g1_i1::g.24057::m.24057/K08796/BRSK; BR serine/threonine kinase